MRPSPETASKARNVSDDRKPYNQATQVTPMTRQCVICGKPADEVTQWRPGTACSDVNVVREPMCYDHALAAPRPTCGCLSCRICNPSKKPGKSVRERKLEAALREMLNAFSMSGALSADGMKRRTDAKKRAREALDS